MIVKVSDYVADFLAKNGIKCVFTVVGGGAMHLNDSLGHHQSLTCVYNHHEQASSMAAEAYYRVNNEMAALCVTSGPGAINALNGVAGAYQDSVPMIVLSGQTKTTLMTRALDLNLRALGNQEFDIISCLSKCTKYAESVLDPQKIRYCLEKAFHIAKTGRPGPCWLELPIDIQGAYVELDELDGFDCNYDLGLDCNESFSPKVDLVFSKIKESKRPIIYAGNGINICGGKQLLHAISDAFQIPVVTCWDSIDLMESSNKLYVGRAGIMGDRPGNFAVQNSDLIIAIGNRLNIYQVGYNIQSWAREAFIVCVDIDCLELTKPTIRVDLPICVDAKIFMNALYNKLDGTKLIGNTQWISCCNSWKDKYPVVTQKHYSESSPINVYALIDSFSKKIPKGAVTVVANGSASVVGSAAFNIKEDSRFIMNCGISSMGYDLPAAIGASFANKRGSVFCIAGDGSIMMNLQELQTISTNNLPVKILIINNQGYHQIRITQTNLFKGAYVGIGPQSKDLSFPDFGKVADAFSIPYKKVSDINELDFAFKWMLESESPCIIDAFCSITQFFEPKSATKILDNGVLYSPPLEDLAPFLSRDELKSNMFIDLLEEI